MTERYSDIRDVRLGDIIPDMPFFLEVVSKPVLFDLEGMEKCDENKMLVLLNGEAFD